MQRGFFLDVKVTQFSPVFELLTGEDQSLFVVLGTFFVLDLLLDVHDRVARLHVQSNRLTGQSLNENLHAITRVHCRLFVGWRRKNFLVRIGIVPLPGFLFFSSVPALLVLVYP